MRKPIQPILIFLFWLIIHTCLHGQEKIEFASPIIDVFSTDLGASRGDLEINYTSKLKKGYFNQAVEIEFTPIKGFGIEVAWLNQPKTNEKLVPENDILEITGQFSRVFNEKFAFAAGLEFEKSMAVRSSSKGNSTYGFRPFLRGGAILKDKIHLQGGFSTELEIGEEKELTPRYSTAAFYQWEDAEAGIEVNGALGKEKSLTITPQFAFSSGRLTIASGIQLPINFGEQESSTINSRLALEHILTKQPCFIIRLTLSFEDKN